MEVQDTELNSPQLPSSKGTEIAAFMVLSSKNGIKRSSNQRGLYRRSFWWELYSPSYYDTFKSMTCYDILHLWRAVYCRQHIISVYCRHCGTFYVDNKYANPYIWISVNFSFLVKTNVAIHLIPIQCHLITTTVVNLFLMNLPEKILLRRVMYKITKW